MNSHAGRRWGLLLCGVSALAAPNIGCGSRPAPATNPVAAAPADGAVNAMAGMHGAHTEAPGMPAGAMPAAAMAAMHGGPAPAAAPTASANPAAMAALSNAAAANGGAPAAHAGPTAIPAGAPEVNPSANPAAAAMAANATPAGLPETNVNPSAAHAGAGAGAAAAMAAANPATNPNPAGAAVPAGAAAALGANPGGALAGGAANPADPAAAAMAANPAAMAGAANVGAPGGAAVGEGGAQAGAASQAQKGTLEYAIVKLAEMAKNGDYAGVSSLISPRAKGLAASIRDGELSNGKIESMKSSFDGLELFSRRSTGSGVQFTLKNKTGQLLQVVVAKEGPEFVIRELTIREPKQ